MGGGIQAMFGGPARDFVFTVTREELQKMETPMLVLMGFLLEDIVLAGQPTPPSKVPGLVRPY